MCVHTYVLTSINPTLTPHTIIHTHSWGYNTGEERAAAEAHPSITHLPAEADFLAYIKRRQQGSGE